jgi:hypothetical protein
MLQFERPILQLKWKKGQLKNFIVEKCTPKGYSVTLLVSLWLDLLASP